MATLRRFRKRTVLLFVGLTLIVPALALCLLAVKLVRDFADIGRTVRLEYGEYVAGVAASALEEALLDREQVNMVAARFVPPGTPEEVVRFLNRFETENPFYLLSFLVVPEGLVHYSNVDPARSARYRPLPDAVIDSVLATLFRQGGVPSGLNHLSDVDAAGRPYQVTWFTLHDEERRMLGAAGFVWNLDQIRGDRAFLDRVLGPGLRGTKHLFQGAFFEAPAVITLLDETNRPFYATAETPGTRFVAGFPFSRVLPFYRVAVDLRDDRFDAWIRTVVWTSSAMIAVMFLVIVVALAFSLRFVLHEIELAELKSTFVSNVSHELKTPLALIRLFSETLELGRVESPEKAREFLHVIGKESERLTHLINNVLDVGRIEQGRKTYRFAPTDLRTLVEGTLEAYAFSLRKQGFVVESALARDLPPIAADADALTQALINLVENAIKYSGDERHLRVDLERRGNLAVLSVADRGIGIPADEQARIFDQFYRVERGLVHTVKGSGLGLALVKHIVDAHHGRVTVESRPGEGSVFTIHLPLAGPPGRDGERAEGGEGADR